MKTINLTTLGAFGRVIHLLASPRRCSRALFATLTGSAWIAAFLLTTACGPPANYAIPSNVATAAPRGTLAVGDKVRVAYPGAVELNQVCKIQADGKIGLPMVGNVSAAGQTTSSLQSTLKAMYETHLNDSTVFVSLEEPAATVYVSGEVGAPGKVPLDRSITALEAVMEVGGFSKLANPAKVYVIRTEGGKQKRYVLNLADPLSGNETQAFYLRAYDVVFVERSNW